MPNLQHMNKNNTIFEISGWSVVKILLILASVWLVFTIKDVLVMLFIALLISSVLDPLSRFLQEKGVPKVVAILGIYFVLMALFGLLGWIFIPVIIAQIRDILVVFPSYLSTLTQTQEFWGISTQWIKPTLVGIENYFINFTTSGLFSSVTSFFGSALSVVVVFVLSLYMMLEEDAIKNALKFILPAQYQPFLIKIYKKIQYKIGLWMRGYLISAFVVWILTLLALILLDVKYALVLSLITPIAEIIPFFGVMIAAVPVCLLVFFDSPIKALFVLIAYKFVDIFETNILTPKVMQKNVGLNPVLIIVSILVGVKLAGFLGAILAIPVLTALSVFVSDVFSRELDNPQSDK
ncbi:MAG: hypothetical protein G01um101418_504 [Parcubacteria group bacterium Gr01-1014_18]|nr:MAG: hypothetical protein Greene041636_550 [Parcubacteria group bacterium Greene0416_36]TSC80967.1 MAG: hypothetical protein G01um101418_504 [Parcubacteria group bacterium Gr01-1014_18]TSC98854.1 MAG: hypothetical protein Greene101420_487 [Parcubacteria group bacterium Greene1014_20]TSD06560.1 MAG: hypothetical protein Greene07142_835 [Parcubacteria group bacterium Greene0714_2]